MYRRLAARYRSSKWRPRLVATRTRRVGGDQGTNRARGVDVRLNAECISLRETGDEITRQRSIAPPAPPKSLVASVAGSPVVGRIPSISISTKPGALRRAWLHRRRRPIATHCAGRLGPRRLQRQGRLHPHRLNDSRSSREFAPAEIRAGSERITAICPLYRPPLGRVGMDFGQTRTSDVECWPANGR